MNWTSNTYCTIQSYRLLAVAEPTFFLITEIAATYTRPLVIYCLKRFSTSKTRWCKIVPSGSQTGLRSTHIRAFVRFFDMHWGLLGFAPCLARKKNDIQQSLEVNRAINGKY